MYHMHLTMHDIEQMDSTEINFVHGWLINQKKEEAEAMKPKKRGKSGIG